MKTVAVRPLADSDVDGYAEHIAHDNLDAALRFLDAVQASYAMIGDYPNIGSARFDHLLEGVRVWALPDFESYFVFYINQPHYVDVIRILHSSMNIPDILIDIESDR